MNTVIYDMPSVQTTLIMQIALKLLIDVGDYGLKTVKQVETNCARSQMASNFSDLSQVRLKDTLLINQAIDEQE